MDLAKKSGPFSSWGSHLLCLSCSALASKRGYSSCGLPLIDSCLCDAWRASIVGSYGVYCINPYKACSNTTFQSFTSRRRTAGGCSWRSSRSFIMAASDRRISKWPSHQILYHSHSVVWLAMEKIRSVLTITHQRVFERAFLSFKANHSISFQVWSYTLRITSLYRTSRREGDFLWSSRIKSLSI